ncbi:MAG TPA: AAA family ATPase [Candidatus Limnocylindria bacterium]|nr:AAA family ATPase [Candidatus Limnocylindria bacterium]
MDVRKTVTVLFCDLVGSTALGDGADPEVLRAQMMRYHAEVRAILEAHGGTVEKFIGDAAMAIFGLPVTHEDDALRAIRAASRIRQAVGELGFEVRIGINTGQVVAGEGETLVTGDAVNVAARLEQSATSGEILIGALTERLVRGAASTEAVEPLQVKGKATPLSAHRLLDVHDDAAAVGRRLDAPFIGRGPELATLEHALSTAIEQGQPQLATIVGPPGIGKSRLVREVIARSPARVLIGRCLSYGQGITYWPLREIAEQIGDIRAVLGAGDEAELAAVRLAAALDEGAATPDEIAWGVRKLLEALAQREPLIVVIDDIHWAEPTLLDLIEYLADFGRDAPMLLLCTARAELLDVRPAWATPRTNATLIKLEPLAAAQAEALVDQLDELPATDRTRIIEAAEGNPLFVEQLIAMRAEVASEDGSLQIPPTIQALLAARIDRLDSDERAVIERASVEGRLFHRGSVQQLLPEPARPEVGRRLLTLVRRQFIRPDRSELPGDDGFRFDHILIRDAAYDSLPKRLRAQLHERFAEWLHARLGGDAPPEILGYHLEQAHRYAVELSEPDPLLAERAAAELLRAASGASARQDVHAEVVLLERAIALLPAGTERSARALLDLGAALIDAGDDARAIERLGEAERIAHEAGAATIEWLARLRRRRLETFLHPEGAPEALVREAEAALAASVDDEVLARARQLIATAHNWRGQLAECHRAIQIAWEHARRTDDARLEADVIYMSGMAIAYGPIPVDEGFSWVARIMQEARGQAAAESWSRHILAHLHARLGDFDAARAAMDSWRSRMRELGQLWKYFNTAECAWDICWLAEDWVGGEVALREAEANYERTGERAPRAIAAGYLAEALVRQHRLDEAEHFARLSEELASTADAVTEAAWRRSRAMILAARGQADQAVLLARRSVELLAGTDLLDEHAAACLALASVLATAGNDNQAREAARQAIALYEQKGNLVGRARAAALLGSGPPTP